MLVRNGIYVNFGEDEPSELAKYSSSVEELERASAERERENDSSDYRYSEDVLGGDLVDDYRSTKDEYEAMEERNKQIRQQNEEAEARNAELDKEFAENHEGRTLDEENEWRHQENERIRAENEERKKRNEEIAKENAEHIANGEPWKCKPLEKYEDEWADAEIDYEEIQEEEQYRAMEGFLPAKNETEAVLQKFAADVLFDGQKVGAWVDFWEAIDKAAPQVMRGIDQVKKGLLVAVDALEKLVDSLKTFVDIVSGLVGKALQMASLAVLLVKAIIASLQTLIGQLMKMFEIALVKSEMKLTTFNLWPQVVPEHTESGLKVPSQIDQMSPALNAVFTEMATQRFNRPIADNSLCFAMLLPAAFSKETAEAIGKTARLIDMFGTLTWDAFRNNRLLRKEAELDYPPFTGGELIITVEEMTKEFGFNGKVGQNPGSGKDRIDAMCGSCIEQLGAMFKPVSKLGEALSKAYGLLAKEEENLAGGGGMPYDSVPGILYQIGAKEEEEGKILVENNFVNNRSQYIASIYRVPSGASKNGVQPVKKIFSDPSFIFAQAVTASGVKRFIDDVIRLFRTSVQWWYSRKVWNPTAEERKFKKALDDTFSEFFGDNTFHNYADSYPLTLASDSLLFIHALRQVIKQKEGFFKNLVTVYDGQKQDKLEYSFRASINPSVPRVRPSFTLKTSDVTDGDLLVFVLVSDRGVYYPHELLSGEGNRSSSYFSSLTPGDLNENMNMRMVKTLVWDKNATMIKPRWYGIGTPPGVDDGTLAWLLNQVGIREYLGVPMQAIKAVEHYLDVGLDYMNAFKEMFDSWVAVFDRYYLAVKDVIAAIRKMLMALGLPNLPSIYVVTWQGGIKDLPTMMMSALAEIGMENSTYAGVVLFGSAEASSEFIEMYHTQMVTKEAIKQMQDDAAKAWEDTKDVASDMAGLATQVTELDPLGIREYLDKKEKEREQKQEKNDPWQDIRTRTAMAAHRVATGPKLDGEDIQFFVGAPLKVPMREVNIETDVCRDDKVSEELAKVARLMEENFGGPDS